jgi:hypothetical protein
MYRTDSAPQGIPNAPPTSDGYVHHGLEYWNRDPTSTETSYVCGGETLDCCSGQNGSGINAAHLVYWGKPVALGAQCV